MVNGKSAEEVYRDVVAQHSGPEDRDYWLVVNRSALLQPAFSPLSSSLTPSEDSGAGTMPWATVFKVGGLYIGSVADMENPQSHDMTWWAHPGLVKPITSQSYLSSPQILAFDLSSYFHHYLSFQTPGSGFLACFLDSHSRRLLHRTLLIPTRFSVSPSIQPQIHHLVCMVRQRHKMGI